ncbi:MULTISPECIES: Coq4 family protein [unclassified Brevundimonas]|uniref:Coq4 family protein n=1 Tax=unclassified Brevundimonas TaxID=2622653 RepID=UPI0025C0786E|nr:MULTISPECIES: Coq4 family protein [unclassified Brevundimonas]
MATLTAQGDLAETLHNKTVVSQPSSTLVRKQVQPLRAIRALRRLVADKDDTEQVFEIMNALVGRSIEWGYRRLLETPVGGVEAYRRAEIAELLQDYNQLRQLPTGSVGEAYLNFIKSQNFSAYGLADESRKVRDSEIEAQHPHAWFARRLRDVHDIWHVLTGYGADALGEACVVAFSLPQTRSKGFGVIAVAIAIQFARARTGYPCARAVWQAWRDGRKAEWLPGVDYAALLAMPLEEARRVLKIPEPVIYDKVPRHLRNAYRGAKAA